MVDPKQPEQFAAEFGKLVDRRGSCGLWTGGTRSEYPIYKRKLATRISYELSIGPVPYGRHVRRRCASRLCVWPDHVIVGDEHVRRPVHVLSRMQADDVRVRRAAGVAIAELADVYGVSTHREYDMTTGNVTARRKPVQNSANGASATFDYDARKLFVIAEHSEPSGITNASQERDYVYEYGTGTKLETIGPNVAPCFTSPRVGTDRSPSPVGTRKQEVASAVRSDVQSPIGQMRPSVGRSGQRAA